ncbi:MAG TPA: 4-hydroxybutyryl-CoA dehydratase, partial [Thermodesulfobacteriota bacterium]|nr:4-hydroxybutyryl-CoA dehydratase [Thermodesulfobacteriota bacterium]
MALKTGSEYLESIKSLALEAHILGKKTDKVSEHGLVEPSQKAVAYTYDCAHQSDTRNLFCVES